MKPHYVPFLLVLFLAGLAFPVSSPAQENAVSIDKSRIPAEAKDVKEFVPSGWKIEEQVTGDLNGDAVPDYALKLIEDKAAKTADDVANDRERALVIVLKNREGKLTRASVADKLLQCATCGGAFYGMLEAPANVQIKRGVLIVNQDHGSREVTELTYRFRYDAASGKFLLIGFDLLSRDRATGEDVSESTNYLTGVRVTKRGKGKKNTTSRTTVSKDKVDLEQVDNEKFESEAGERLKI